MLRKLIKDDGQDSCRLSTDSVNVLFPIQLLWKLILGFHYWTQKLIQYKPVFHFSKAKPCSDNEKTCSLSAQFSRIFIGKWISLNAKTDPSFLKKQWNWNTWGTIHCLSESCASLNIFLLIWNDFNANRLNISWTCVVDSKG